MTFVQQWRRFNFFNKDSVEIYAKGRTYDTIRPNKLTCFACGRGALIFGDENGGIHIMNHTYQVTSFQAYQISVSIIHQVMKHNVLVAVGMDEAGVNPVIKVWNMDKKEKNGQPFCTRIQSAIPNNIPTDVSALSVHENLNVMVAGFADGSIGVYKGDVLKSRHSNRNVFISTGQSGPVTGVHLYSHNKDIYLFATTHTSILSYNLGEKTPKLFTLDDRGCPMGCSVLSSELLNNQMVVASNDAVYAYQPDSRGACYAFEGDKIMIRWYGDYLLIVYKDKTRSSAASSRASVEKNMLTIYDMNQKLIAYSHALPSVKEVLFEWGSLYVVTANNELVCLQEKDIHNKLEILFKKNHYSLAVNMARNQNLGEEGLVEIFTQYGDHLYSKGDFDGAITQYIKTIRYLEPSYIIRKFLDAQRIHNLTEYLQVLHESGEATKDHTTLLLNCFTKLKDNDNLNKFIMTPESKLQFDVETAIKVCRHTGFYQHALALAEKHSKHKWYLKIQLEDKAGYEKALHYIRKLSFEEAETNMKQYGKILVNHLPEKATALLKDLCTDYRPPHIKTDDYSDDYSTSPRRANGEEFIHIFVNNSKMLINFLQHIIKVDPKSSEVVYNTLLELYFQQFAGATDVNNRKRLSALAIDLIKDIASLDYGLDQALVLCQMHNFREGILHLYEVAGLYQQILKYHMDHEAYGMVVDSCRKHGSKDTSLWQHALVYLTHAETDCHEHIQQVLTHIDKHNLLPPLLVVQLLSRNSTVTLGVVKEYIIHQLKQELNEISDQERSIAQYREETEKMEEKIKDLETKGTIFQVTKCGLCSHNLELPSVHFLCKHSFHQHCFESYADSEHECPICSPENRKILEHIREQEQVLQNNQVLHDQFLTRLSANKDGFSVVADYFSKGLFNKVTSVSEIPGSLKLEKQLEYSPFDSKKTMASPVVVNQESVHFSPGVPAPTNQISAIQTKKLANLRAPSNRPEPAKQNLFKPQPTTIKTVPIPERSKPDVASILKSQMAAKQAKQATMMKTVPHKKQHSLPKPVAEPVDNGNPFDEPMNSVGDPDTQKDNSTLNPFGDPDPSKSSTSPLNPFDSPPGANPFEDDVGTNSFGNSESNNPFESNDSGNPFEEDEAGGNPFE